MNDHPQEWTTLARVSLFNIGAVNTRETTSRMLVQGVPGVHKLPQLKPGQSRDMAQAYNTSLPFGMFPLGQVKKWNMIVMLMWAIDYRQRGIEPDVVNFDNDTMEEGFRSWHDYLYRKDNTILSKIPKLADHIDFDDWYTKFQSRCSRVSWAFSTQTLTTLLYLQGDGVWGQWKVTKYVANDKSLDSNRLISGQALGKNVGGQGFKHKKIL